MSSFRLTPIGRVRSTLRHRTSAPKQGREGAPDARLEIFPDFAAGLNGIAPGAEIIVLTWLHEAERQTLEVHPRDDESRPLTGVFATRSADRPNPVGLHRVTVLNVDRSGWLAVTSLEAIDGTPVIDLKPVLDQNVES